MPPLSWPASSPRILQVQGLEQFIDIGLLVYEQQVLADGAPGNEAGFLKHKTGFLADNGQPSRVGPRFPPGAAKGGLA